MFMLQGREDWEEQSPHYSLLRTSRKDTRTVSSPATATWLMSWRSLWYGHRVSVPLPR